MKFVYAVLGLLLFVANVDAGLKEDAEYALDQAAAARAAVDPAQQAATAAKDDVDGLGTVPLVAPQCVPYPENLYYQYWADYYSQYKGQGDADYTVAIDKYDDGLDLEVKAVASFFNGNYQDCIDEAGAASAFFGTSATFYSSAETNYVDAYYWGDLCVTVIDQYCP